MIGLSVSAVKAAVEMETTMNRIRAAFTCPDAGIKPRACHWGKALCGRCSEHCECYQEAKR